LWVSLVSRIAQRSALATIPAINTIMPETVSQSAAANVVLATSVITRIVSSVFRILFYL